MIDVLTGKLVINFVSQNLNSLVNSFRWVLFVVLLSGELDEADLGGQLTYVNKEEVLRACF